MMGALRKIKATMVKINIKTTMNIMSAMRKMKSTIRKVDIKKKTNSSSNNSSNINACS